MNRRGFLAALFGAVVGVASAAAAGKPARRRLYLPRARKLLAQGKVCTGRSVMSFADIARTMQGCEPGGIMVLPNPGPYDGPPLKWEFDWPKGC